MTHLGSLLLCLAGFAGLALAMGGQQPGLLRRPLPSATRAALRVAASCALAAALGILVAWQGWGLGLVMFSGHTSLAAGLVHCTLIGYKRVCP